MHSSIIALLASTVIGLASAENLKPCGNAFYVPSQVSIPENVYRSIVANNWGLAVYVLQRQQALPDHERRRNEALRAGLLLRNPVLVRIYLFSLSCF